MTSPRKPGFVLPVAVTLAVLLGLYVGAYYAMVTPMTAFRGGFLTEDGVRDAPVTAVYSHGGEFCHRIFMPVNWLDRRIRPDFWRPSLDDVKRRFGF